MFLLTSLRHVARLSLLLFVLSGLHNTRAGSATWNINPTDDWNTARNWTPATVPNSATDIATFADTNMFEPVIHSSVEVDSIVFVSPFQNSNYIITVGDAGGGAVATLTVSGTGIVDESINSGQIVQAAPTLSANGAANIIFLTNDAALVRLGSSGIGLGANGGTSAGSTGGQVQLLDNSTIGPGSAAASAGENGGSAGEILFLDNSSASKVGGPSNGQLFAFGSGAGSTPGQIIFKGTSTASNASIESFGATAPGVEGGKISFLESSDAGDFVIAASPGGASVPDAAGGTITFSDTASASSATLEAFGSSVSGGGSIRFLGDSSGGTAQVELTQASNATLVISDHNPPGITIGSLSDGFFEGHGIVLLGSNNLTIGNNNLSTTFSGVIEGSGSVTKIGTGTLTLRGDNTYSGATTVRAGTLIVAGHIAVGIGEVKVMSATLAGSGVISREVTVGRGAFLAPSVGRTGPHQHIPGLTIEGALHFKAESIYSCLVNTRNGGIADQVIANGVTIAADTTFSLTSKGNGVLPAGTTFVVISNTATTSINGTFANLADGAIVSAGGNNFQASYEGGDGNDLTLTVVP